MGRGLMVETAQERLLTMRVYCGPRKALADGG
jgi:hypothetical protein